MKGILKIVLIVTIVFTASLCKAQIQPPPTVNIITSQQLKSQEYVFFKNGNLMLHIEGKETVLIKAYTCSNGSIVANNGIVMRNDGTSTKLYEGDRVYKDGTIVSGLNAS